MATTQHSGDDVPSREPLVLFTEEEPGVGRFTVSLDEEDFRFEVAVRGDTIELEYVETLSYRGQIRVSEPRDEVYDVLTASDEFQSFVEVKS